MKHTFEASVLSLFQEILAEEKSEDEWAEIESDDLLQKHPYVGGYDADEKAFCFSYYSPSGKEYWFQLTLIEVERAVSGLLTQVDLRKADL